MRDQIEQGALAALLDVWLAAVDGHDHDPIQAVGRGGFGGGAPPP